MNGYRVNHSIDESRELLSQLGDLARQDAELERSILGVMTRAPHDERELASLVAGRASLADRRLSLLTRWMVLLARRMGAVESNSEDLANRVRGQEENLRMMCEVLKDLDDPYGFGTSLDERIAEDGPDRGTSETGG